MPEQLELAGESQLLNFIGILGIVVKHRYNYILNYIKLKLITKYNGDNQTITS